MRGAGVEETARAIVSMVDEAMLGALRVVTVQRGRVPSDFALVAFGGAGGLHANALAPILGCYPVIVPEESGVLSALGFISSEIKNEFSQTFVKSIAATTPDAVRKPFDVLTARARDWLDSESVDVADQDVRFILDMRYSRQGYEIPIELDGVELAALDLAALERRFGEEHTRLYGFVLEGGAEIVNLRVVATGRVPLPELEARPEGDAGRLGRADRHAAGLDAGGNARRPDLRARRARAGHGDRRLRDRRAVRRDHRRAPGPSSRRRPLDEPADPARGGEHVKTTIDVATLDLIENALLNARFEMDEVVRRAAMSPMIRVQHDEFPMICNARGQMVVGQFGSYIPEVIDRFGGEIGEGDVILLNDPYLCKGSISHCNDWLVILPIFFEGKRVAFASLFGHMMDVGGKVPGSQVSDALSIWEEGIRIPPIKIFDRGVLNETALEVILNNTRTPDTNRSDLMAIIGGCRAAERRIVEICERFGPDTFEGACDALLERTRGAMAHIIRRYIPEEPVTFTDWVDDDGLGNGPFKMVLTIWREGDVCHADWTGTDDQAPGSINFHIHEGLCKLFLGIYMIMAFDPEILFNDGIYDVFEVTLPEGSLLNPKFPAPLSNRLNVHTRLFDCISGALGQNAPDLSMAAGYGTSPFFVFSGYDDDGEYFQFVELLFGGLPARYSADGLDGHSWWPLFRTTPAEYAESYYPVRISSYVPGARHRGRRAPPRRNRDREDLRLPRPGRVHRQRRPCHDPAVGDQRRTPRRLQHEDADPRVGRGGRAAVQDRPGPGGRRRHARFPDRRRRRVGRPARPRPRARPAGRAARSRLARGGTSRVRRRHRRRRRRPGRHRGRARATSRAARPDRALRLRPRSDGRTRMTTSLRSRLAEPGAIVALGAHDGLTARIAERAGVEALYHGGYALAAHHFGLPDVGLVGRAEVVESVRRMRGATDLPIIVDADTGYGSEAGVWLTTRELEAVGANAVQIEDQVSPKRCGHMEGKEVIPAEEMVIKVRAAVAARRSDETLIIARSDALQVTGLEDTIARCNAYGEAGADLVFVDAPRSVEEYAALAERCSTPSVANMSETGRSPAVPTAELESMGYKLVIFPSTQTWVFAKAYEELCRAVIRDRTTTSLADRFTSFDDVNALLGLAEWQSR